MYVFAGISYRVVIGAGCRATRAPVPRPGIVLLRFTLAVRASGSRKAWRAIFSSSSPSTATRLANERRSRSSRYYCYVHFFLCIQFLFTTFLLCIDSTLARILWCAVFFSHLSHSYSLQLKEEKERAQREEEERRNRIELEQFQRKFEKGRSKDRRRPEVEAVAPSRPVYLYLLGAAIPLLSAFFALWWMNA